MQTNYHLRAGLLLAAAAFALTLMGLLHQPALRAQDDDYTAQDALAVVYEHPAFAGLDDDAYEIAVHNSGNAYGVWRVTVWDEEGEEIAWADVSPASGELYSYEARFGPSGDQFAEGEDAVRAFLEANQELETLLGHAPDPDSTWIDYDAWSGNWGAWIDEGTEPLYVVVRFGDGGFGDFDEPELIGIYFPEVPDYEDWYNARSSQAVAIAFADTEVAAATREADEWTTRTEMLDENGDQWLVTFLSGETTLVEVSVDVSSGSITEARFP